jgi:hypothetical protein
MGDRRGRKQERKQTAELLRDNLPQLFKLTPNPCELTHPVDPDAIDEYRLLDCENYQKCVNIASMAFWNALSCRGCPVYKEKGESRSVPKVRNVDA